MASHMKVVLENKRLKGTVVNREALILSYCKNKTVLHLGCADWPYSIEQQQNGVLLHEKLHEITGKVTGIDISKEGVDFLKSLGYKNIFLKNVEDQSQISSIEIHDIIVAGELLEHLSNVGLFFENIHSVMDETSVLIITTPNAHSLKIFARVFGGSELIHPDHLCYFSPATIAHLCKRYGYEISDYFYYLSEPKSFFKKIIFMPIKLFIKFICPRISDGLVFIVKLREKNA